MEYFIATQPHHKMEKYWVGDKSYRVDIIFDQLPSVGDIIETTPDNSVLGYGYLKVTHINHKSDSHSFVSGSFLDKENSRDYLINKVLLVE